MRYVTPPITQIDDTVLEIKHFKTYLGLLSPEPAIGPLRSDVFFLQHAVYSGAKFNTSTSLKSVMSLLFLSQLLE